MSLSFSRKSGYELAAGLEDGDVDVEEAEAAEGATEILVHPEFGQETGVKGNPVYVPSGEPREDQQKQTQFEGKDDETDA